MPIYSFYCSECDFEFDSLMMPWEGVGGIQCPHCRTGGVVKLPTSHASYKIKGDNSASTKPRKS